MTHHIKHTASDVINVKINDYNDLFSDFDITPYKSRNISDDFINEIKKISKNKDLPLKEINIYLPQQSRNDEEQAITKRLHSFFQSRLHQYNIEAKKLLNRGLWLLVTGIALLICISILLSMEAPQLIKIVCAIAEPGIWFLIWMGLDFLFFAGKVQKKDREFYFKVAKAEIKFYTKV